MSSMPLAVLRTGMMTSVGLNAPAACAAIRAGLSSPTESRFADGAGEWIMNHVVPFEPQYRGRSRLVRLAAGAIAQCLGTDVGLEFRQVPLLVCVAEESRPGRIDGLDESFLQDIQEHLGMRFADESAVIARGRVGGAVALLHARKLIHERVSPAVLIVGVDSLLLSATLEAFEQLERLLTSQNSNGFIPAEGSAAVLVGPSGASPHLCIEGLGFAIEKAHIGTEEPLRADGLSLAIQNALTDAGCEMHDLCFRITDNSGEQYYFKEAALALSRTLKRPKETFDLWHPAECVGEAGSAILPIQIAVADTACRKQYVPGSPLMIHAGTDEGHRAAVVVRFASA